MPQGRTLAGTSAAVAACAVTGSIASQESRGSWYLGLDKPPWLPPTVAFPIAWTTLYADIAVTSASALDELAASDPEAARVYRMALAKNLVLNAGWSWVFFRAHRLGPAAAVALALAASSADLVRRTYVASPKAGAAMAPYALWCGFATALSVSVWRRNPRKR